MASYQQPCSCKCGPDSGCPCLVCEGRGVVVGNGSATGGYGAYVTCDVPDLTAGGMVTVKRVAR